MNRKRADPDLMFLQYTTWRIKMSVLEPISPYYDFDYTAALTTQLWWVPVVAICSYLTLIAVGRKWMETKQPYGLRRPLFLWNLCLAILSMLGAIVMLPSRWNSMWERGFEYSVCYTSIHTAPLQAIFSLIFVFSKLVEFGDTFFIVLRKTPLNFLHWYHHVTVCIISWHFQATKSAPGHWCMALNYSVHSVMYSYYVIKSTGIRVPKIIALGVTALQLIQFLVGILVSCTAFNVFVYRGEDCEVAYSIIIMAMAFYFSYIVLFGNFFYQRYIKPKQKKLQ